MLIQSYRDLEAWRLGMDFVVDAVAQAIRRTETAATDPGSLIPGCPAAIGLRHAARITRILPGGRVRLTNVTIPDSLRLTILVNPKCLYENLSTSPTPKPAFRSSLNAPPTAKKS